MWYIPIIVSHTIVYYICVDIYEYLKIAIPTFPASVQRKEVENIREGNYPLIIDTYIF